jgi:hypothetical protein
MKDRAEAASKSPQWTTPKAPAPEDVCGTEPPEAVRDDLRIREPKPEPEKPPARRVTKRR